MLFVESVNGHIMYKIKFHQNFESDEIIYNKVVSMTPKNSGRWKNIIVTKDNNYDFLVILNHPNNIEYDNSKTIVFESETKTTRESFPKFYQETPNDFFYIHDTKNHFNVDLWYHGLYYDELIEESNFIKDKNFSIINSNLSSLPGHVMRNNFIQYLSYNMEYDLFGRYNSNNKYYKGSLNKKSDGLRNYKYTFNCENDFEDNYFTEKILDGIFCECLTFYCGCPNIENFINKNSFIKLDLNNFEESLYIIKYCIENNVYEKMKKDIVEEKRRIMNDYNILNIVQNIIEEK